MKTKTVEPEFEVTFEQLGPQLYKVRSTNKSDGTFHEIEMLTISKEQADRIDKIRQQIEREYSNKSEQRNQAVENFYKNHSFFVRWRLALPLFFKKIYFVGYW